MKLIFTLFLISLTTFAQSKDSAIRDIKRQYLVICELLEQGSLEEISTESDCTGNGQMNTFASFYYHNDSLVYIHCQRHEGHNDYNDHYYLWNNQLIFFFSEYSSWIWDYESTPPKQGFTNEIWTYEEQRTYFNNETPIKCLYKTYQQKSADLPHEESNKLSDTIKNVVIDCGSELKPEVIRRYLYLRNFQKDNTNKSICTVYD